MIDFTRNHFALFGLEPRFAIDPAALDRAWRALQAEVHPDRYAQAPDAERRLALQASARVNEAYRTLKEPVTRAAYLLAIQGAADDDERDTSLSVDFLERQLERREAASEAADREDLRALEHVLADIRGEVRDREAVLVQLLDRDRDLASARTAVRELRFLSKVVEDVDAMAAAIDA